MAVGAWQQGRRPALVLNKENPLRTTRRRLAAAALTIGLAAAGTSPAKADQDHATSDHSSVTSGLLGGLSGGDDGLLGPRGLLGSAGGLLPGLLGGHSTVGEFTGGAVGLVDGLSVLPGALAGAPPVGGGHVGENVRIADGVLSGVLDLGSILSGLTGRL